MEDVCIREMKFEDLIEVFKLGEKTFTADNWPILYRTWDEYEIIDRFLSDSEYCLVVENEKGKIVGFIIGVLIKKHKGTWIYGYINWIALRKDYQKKMLGKRLFNSLANKFKKDGANMLMIDTSPDNEAAVKFFEKLGFAKQEEHIYMFKNLTKKNKHHRSKVKKLRGDKGFDS